jgi:hypothetical protein
MKFVILLLMSAGFSFAGTWSGALVDAKCWGFRERNVNPRDTLTFVDRDRNLEISFCTPNTKTNLFAIVPPDGVSLQLDAAGNAKAADVVRTAGKKSLIHVNVTGEADKQTIAVTSISAAK